MKRVAFMFTLAAFVTTAGAQILHDPYDPIYRDIEVWANRGYIAMLPPVLPYPPQVAESLLAAVIDRGDPSSAAKARAYLSAIGSGGVHPAASATVNGIDRDVTPLVRVGADALFRPEAWMAISLSFDAYGARRAVGDEIIVPGVYSPYPDMVNDNSSVGATQILQNWNSVGSFGNERLYFQAGMNRGSFGPFFENGLVLGPQAGHAGHFVLGYRGERWSATVMHLALSASSQFYELQRDKNFWYPNKHFVLHSFRFNPLPGLELGVFESVMYGDRIDLLYAAPFNFLFQAQGVAGFLDNSYLGLDWSWLVGPGLRFKGLVYVDDLGFNSLARLQFDTKYKFAAQAGIALSPRGGILESLEADYSAVMPYMYTHNWDFENSEYSYTDINDAKSKARANYSNYMHMGQPLGTGLLPNSDRFSLRTRWRLWPFLSLRLGGELIHHGNASSNYYDTPDTEMDDGGYLDDGRDDAEKATFNRKTRFLTQDVIETTLRLSQGLDLRLPTKLGDLSLGADLVAEFGWNRRQVGVGPVEGDDGVSLLYSLTATWRY